MNLRIQSTGNTKNYQQAFTSKGKIIDNTCHFIKKQKNHLLYQAAGFSSMEYYMPMEKISDLILRKIFLDFCENSLIKNMGAKNKISNQCTNLFTYAESGLRGLRDFGNKLIHKNKII